MPAAANDVEEDGFETELAEAALGDGFGALPPIGGPDAADSGAPVMRSIAMPSRMKLMSE